MSIFCHSIPLSPFDVTLLPTYLISTFDRHVKQNVSTPTFSRETIELLISFHNAFGKGDCLVLHHGEYVVTNLKCQKPWKQWDPRSEQIFEEILSGYDVRVLRRNSSVDNAVLDRLCEHFERAFKPADFLAGTPDDLAKRRRDLRRKVWARLHNRKYELKNREHHSSSSQPNRSIPLYGHSSSSSRSRPVMFGTTAIFSGGISGPLEDFLANARQPTPRPEKESSPQISPLPSPSSDHLPLLSKDLLKSSIHDDRLWEKVHSDREPLPFPRLNRPHEA